MEQIFEWLTRPAPLWLVLFLWLVLLWIRKPASRPPELREPTLSKGSRPSPVYEPQFSLKSADDLRPARETGATYAQGHCYVCHRKLPKPDMHERVDYWTYTRSSPRIWVCNSCIQDFDWSHLKTKLIWGAIFLLAPLAPAIFLGLAWLSGRNQ